MNKNIYGLTLLGVLFLFSNCNSYKRAVYFQGDAAIANSPSNYKPLFKTDDYISVIVTADDPETAVPFNFPQDIGMNRQMMGGGMNMQLGMPVNNGYLIDDSGYVSLPVIGRMYVLDLNRQELVRKLTEKYKAYLSNPIVNVKILNFKITVLGDVRNPGTYLVPNERLTIIEALGMAGDLQMTGQRTNILIIRDRDGVKTEYRIDLTSKEVLSSPVYYLEQNDIIYVEPNAVSRTSGSFWRAVGPTLLGIASFTISTILLITNVN